MNATVQPTAYMVSLLPVDDINADLFAITVEWRGDNNWAVMRHRQCLNSEGEWDWEPNPSSRTDEFIATHRFDRDTAIEMARKVAPTVMCNGITAAEAYADRGAP